MEIDTKMRTFELINSNEWQLIKELLRVYSNSLIVKGIQLTAEEANDRKRALYLSSAKYFEDFINQIEGQAQKEVQDSKEQEVVRQTIPEF
ncbi:MAG: hypothetical protein EOM40_19305 [Clostridia bacterium]|nr:hypothetical protein [Clostridia bacterium]